MNGYNGLLAQHAAVFDGALAISAAFIFAHRGWEVRATPFSREVFIWLTVLLGALGGNRVTVALYYKGMIGSSSLWPTFFSAAIGISLLMLARLYTRNRCGRWGWLALLVAATICTLVF